jgi:hypothetical protein
LISAREIGALRMLPKASALLLLFGTGEVDKHPTTRITDNLLSAVRACSNSGIENVPSVCASQVMLPVLPERWTNMKKNGVVLTSVLLVLLGIQTPQFAQDTSIDPAKTERAKHRIAIGLLRTINTAEVTHQYKNGSYATWQTILLSQPKYFDDFLARNNRNSQQTFQVGAVQPKAPFFGSRTLQRYCPDGVCA